MRDNLAWLIGDTLLVRDGESLIAYSPVKGKIARLSAHFLSEDDHRLLVDSGFCNPKPTTARCDTEWKGFRSLTLLLTRQCNLQCVYCYAKAKSFGPSMPIELAIDALDFYVRRLPRGHIRVCFHGGGEPSLEMGLIRSVVSRSDEIGAGKETTFLITTNGTAPFSDYKWMMSRSFKISISMDGPPDIQNRNRALVGGGKSSPIVEETVRSFVREGYPFTIRMSYSSDTSMTETLEYLARLGVRSVHLEPIFPYGRDYDTIDFGPRSVGPVAPPSPKEMVQKFLETMDTCERLGIVIYNSHFMNLSSSSAYFCGLAAGRAMVVTHDGILTGCLEVVDGQDPDIEVFRCGSWNPSAHSFELDQEQLKRLRARHADGLNPCSKCFARYTCAGGCAAKAVRQHRDFYQRDTPYCAFTRAVLLEVVKRIARASSV